MKTLSRRQQAILQFIEHFLDENDYPPTIRDIQSELDISSTSVVDYNLKALEARGLIRRNSKISRGIELVNRGVGRRNIVAIPVIGQIAAGLPIPVPGDLEGSDAAELIELSGELVPDGGRGLFALRVKGHSMVDALINDGDIVLLRRQGGGALRVFRCRGRPVLSSRPPRALHPRLSGSVEAGRASREQSDPHGV